MWFWKSITNKLLFWFLLLSIVPLLVFGYTTYQTASYAITTEIENTLVAIADSKTETIEITLRNMQSSLQALSRSVILVKAVTDFQRNPRQARLDYGTFFRAVDENYNFEEFTLVDPQGKVLFSTEKNVTELVAGSERAKVFNQTTTLIELTTSRFENLSVQETNQPDDLNIRAYIAVPILDTDNSIVGTVIVGFSNRIFFNITKNYTGLGQTGESFVIAPVGSKYIYITPPRDSFNDAHLEKLKSILANDRSIQKAIQGTNGFGFRRDYRNNLVFSAWQYLPTLNGGLIVKIDVDEAFNILFNLRNSSLGFGVISGIVILLIALGLAKSISQPIIDLTSVTQSIIKGEFTWEAPISSGDEIGILAQSFNAMMNRVYTSITELEHINQELEYRVEERTKSLQWANVEIQMLNEKLKEENTRMSSELEITRKLQQLILPKPGELETIPSLDIAGFMQPATEVGGDYYDVIQSNGSIKVGVGDITGHGLESGILMIMLQTAVRTLAHAEIRNPMRFINILNRVIYENVHRMDTDKSLTLVLLDYSHKTKRLQITGQHEEAIIIRSDGTVQCIDTIDLGFPIGIESDISNFVGQVTIQLSQGDGVILYTDGITEAEDTHGRFYGKERLCQVGQNHIHQSAEEIRTAIIQDLKLHIGEQMIFDDITLVVLKKID